MQVWADFHSPGAWSNHSLRIADLDGTVRAELALESDPDPSFVQRCAPSETECLPTQSGSVELERVADDGGDVLFPGEVSGYATARGRYRVLLGFAWEATEWFCAEEGGGGELATGRDGGSYGVALSTSSRR